MPKYRDELDAQLLEEAAELAEATESDVAEELADVREVLLAIAELNGIQWADVNASRGSDMTSAENFGTGCTSSSGGAEQSRRSTGQVVGAMVTRGHLGLLHQPEYGRS